MTQKIHIFFFYCKLGITVNDKMNGTVKYMNLTSSVIKAMHIILRLTIFVTTLRK